MKTLRFALIAAMIACTTVALANTDGFKIKPKTGKVVNMTFTKAVENPGLVTAMYQQLNPSFLINVQHLYIVEVKYNNCLYRIMGSRWSWISFFSNKGKYLMDVRQKDVPEG